jgi:hypothetical protein
MRPPGKSDGRSTGLSYTPASGGDGIRTRDAPRSEVPGFEPRATMPGTSVKPDRPKDSRAGDRLAQAPGLNAVS